MTSSILSETSMALEPPTPPTRTSEKLRTDLETVNAQLASMKKQWEDKKRQLIGDKAVLQDATTRLNAEVRQAKSEIQRYAESERASEKAKANMQGVSHICLDIICSQTDLDFTGARQGETHGRGAGARLDHRAGSLAIADDRAG